MRLTAFLSLAALAALSAGCAGLTGSSSGKAGLRFGAVLPLTGNEAALGRSLQRGLQLGEADVNAAGGVNGQPISVTILNSVGSSSESAETLEALASPYQGGDSTMDGSDALDVLSKSSVSVILVGDPSLADTQVAALAQYPQVVGFLCDFVSGPEMTKKNGLRLYLNGDQEAQAIEQYINAAGVAKAAIIHVSEPSAESNAKWMDFQLQGDHLTTYIDAYSPGEHDFALLARVMQTGENGAIVMIGDGPEYPDILSAFDNANWHGLAFGYITLGHLPPPAKSGGVAIGAMYPVPDFAINPRDTDAGRAFADRYKAKYGEDPDLPAAYAYDNVLALAAAATQAGSFDPAKIRAAYLAMKTYVGAVGRYDIQFDGDTKMPLQLVYANGQPALPPEHAIETPGIVNLPASSTPAQPKIDENSFLPAAPAKP